MEIIAVKAMPSFLSMEVIALILLAAAAAVAAFYGRRPPTKGKPWSPRTVQVSDRQEKGFERKHRSAAKPRDAADQLRTVMHAPFQKQRLMSKGEYDVFRTVESHLRNCGPGFRLMAQPSMGEFLHSTDAEAYRSVNSKRVDMLVIDTHGFPVVAIEHQGPGHHQGDAAARDAVKREALRRAGVEFLEIFDYHQAAEICRLVSDSIQRNKPPTSPGMISPFERSPN
ncbi:DUF2726 domain-containing protein [Devosia rhizoryzae]|uniref:DUF2726 domain-containing protein n=1 Tax=Devosia rhizoryzae TaxID=2774137 RepID=A0ABX7C500_9HYPH|nr:DUF2726 domain-containing protein [Devosia rhizoryzae]QQR39322.1 DUF2726 domain-containing protein [Devosia rhizoryzae]